MSWAEIALAAMVGAIFVWAITGGILVIHGTIFKTRWGVNHKGTYCPKCGAKLSPPLQKTWWGAWTKDSYWANCTCFTCKIKVDLWGRQIDG
ncbi:MAG: hypothetical protein ACRCY3_08570 [Sphingorhabdus sp.]